MSNIHISIKIKEYAHFRRPTGTAIFSSPHGSSIEPIEGLRIRSYIHTYPSVEQSRNISCHCLDGAVLQKSNIKFRCTGEWMVLWSLYLLIVAGAEGSPFSVFVILFSWSDDRGFRRLTSNAVFKAIEYLKLKMYFQTILCILNYVRWNVFEFTIVPSVDVW